MDSGRSRPEGSAAAWPGFLRGETSDEIFCRLREHDPLRLREASALRLREVWYLLEPDRVFLRSLAVVAEHARLDDPPEDLAAWARAKVDVAIERLLRLDVEAERTRPEVLTDEERAFPLLTESMWIEPESVRRVTVAFNALDPLPRRAFFELAMAGKSVEEVVAVGPWDDDGLHDAIQQAIESLTLGRPEDRVDPTSFKAVNGPAPEHHLRDETRETLADLCIDAAFIAYHKAPVWSWRPARPDGTAYDPREMEPEWAERTRRFLEQRIRAGSDGEQLIRDSLRGIRAGSAGAFAREALRLAPSDRARFYIGLAFPWDRPDEAIGLFERLSDVSWPPRSRLSALLCLGSRLCAAGRIADALAAYERYCDAAPTSIYGHLNALNLCCYLGRLEPAMNHATALFQAAVPEEPSVQEVSRLLASWWRSRNAGEVAFARKALRIVAMNVPPVTRLGILG